MKHLLIAISLLAYSLGAVGQVTATGYTPLVSEGQIPQEFLTLSSAKYEAERQVLEKSESKATRKTREAFLISSNYVLDRLLLSGMVTFNDPVTVYVNKVMQEVLKNEPELRSKIRVYTVKSAAVNAFATDNGIVLVNLGLLAQIENEAQLAFVLSHEVSHYKKKHAMDMYVTSNTIARGKGAYKDISIDDKLIARSNYSKELETEADEMGLERYLQSAYSLKAIDGAFDVLAYAHLPFDEVEFDKAFFESNHLKFPKDYYLDTISPITSEEDREVEDDDRTEENKYSTHPSVSARRTNIGRQIKDKGNGSRQDFVISKEDFLNVRNIARFEISRLYMVNNRFEEAIYNSYLLLKQYPENLYLKKVIAKSLLGLTVYANEGQFNEVHVRYKDMEGESQRLYYFIDKLYDNREELNIMALSYAWSLKKAYPQDKDIKKITDQLFTELAYKLDLTPEKFSTEARKQVPDSVASVTVTVDTTASENLSKYAKIKRGKSGRDKDKQKDEYYTYAFVDLLKDEEFMTAFKAKVKDAKAKDKKENLSEKEKLAQEKIRLKNSKLGLALNIDKVAVVEPFYIKIDLRNKESFDYLGSESGQIDLTKTIKEAADMADVNCVVVHSRELQAGDVSTFNDMATLNEWVDEQMSHDGEMQFTLQDQERMDQLKTKFGTRYFLWTGTISAREKPKIAPWIIIYSVMVPPLLPYTIAKTLNTRNYTYYYSLLYDLENNEVVMGEYVPIPEKDRKTLLQSRLYYTFKQIGHKRK